MNLTLAITGASGTILGRELLCAIEETPESFAATSHRPAVRAVGAMLVSPALQRGVGNRDCKMGVP
jgi:3-polyprenyl-4-hydroxybenzoate decarboxylase